jgi:hypothetical protein
LRGVNTAPSRPRPIAWVAANPVPAALLAALVVSAGVLTAIGWRLSFFLDDWTFMLYRRGSFDQAFMNPHGENVVIGLSLVYKALVNVFGMNAVAFRAVLTGFILLSGGLLFVYLRRRVGDWLALVGTSMILLLGAAYEDLLWPIQIGYFISFTCGLGALMLLQRDDRRGDPLACMLLTFGIISFSLGIPFAVGAAVAIGLGADRWRRAYVVAIPIGVYALWWLGWGHEAEGSIGLLNISTSPIYLFEGFASSLSSLLGLATPGSQEAIGALAWGRPLFAVALALGVYRLHRLGRVPPWLWVVLATALSFWLLAGFNEKSGREPTVSRYQHIGAVFILMIAAELFVGTRLRRPAMVLITVLAGAAILSSGSYLLQARNSYLHTSELERAGLAAIEISRDTVDPGFMLAPDLVDTGYVYVSAQSYLAALDDYGHSPAFTTAELASAPEAARVAGDKTLAAALRVSFTEGVPSAGGDCSVIDTTTAPAVAAVPLGGASVESIGDGRLTIKLHRFADGFPITAGTLAAGRSGDLVVAADRAAEPWELELSGDGVARVCAQAGE